MPRADTSPDPDATGSDVEVHAVATPPAFCPHDRCELATRPHLHLAALPAGWTLDQLPDDARQSTVPIVIDDDQES